MWIHQNHQDLLLNYTGSKEFKMYINEGVFSNYSNCSALCGLCLCSCVGHAYLCAWVHLSACIKILAQPQVGLKQIFRRVRDKSFESLLTSKPQSSNQPWSQPNVNRQRDGLYETFNHLSWYLTLFLCLTGMWAVEEKDQKRRLFSLFCFIYLFFNRVKEQCQSELVRQQRRS